MASIIEALMKFQINSMSDEIRHGEKNQSQEDEKQSLHN